MSWSPTTLSYWQEETILGVSEPAESVLFDFEIGT